MDKVDWENAPDWADRVLRTLTGAIIFSDSNYFLSENGEKIKHGSLLEVFPNGHELLSFKYGNCTIIEMRPDEWKKGAERMEPIVQNGNDGEHYAELEGIDKTLNERGCRYGEFYDNSRVAQELKRVMKSGKNTDDLRDIQREALEVIASKIARIVNGDPDYIDNWHDIIGYAKLVEIELEKEKGE